MRRGMEQSVKLPKLTTLSSTYSREAESFTSILLTCNLSVRDDAAKFIKSSVMISIESIKTALEWSVYD